MNQKDVALFNDLLGRLLQDEIDNPVAEPIDASRLFETLDLALPEKSSTRAEFESALTELVLHTPKTSSKRFFNQLFGGRKSESVLGDLLAVMLNNSMYTYKVAGPMVGVEKEVLRKIIGLVGYPSEADGTFAAGGSMTNFMAMIMARDRAVASVRTQGVRHTMTLYTSMESHYSIQKNAAFMGVGRDQIRFIETDDRGRMLPADLEAHIQRDLTAGHLPFFVNATAGTTVLGAFDPIDKIQPICEKYNLWLHVDGAYCGSVIFSEQYNHLIKGLDKTDSFSVNAHKMLNTTLICSIIVTRDKKHLYDSFANEASYLYQTDADDFNLGKTSLQCGRRNDALKVWTLWKAIGREGIGQMIDQQFYLADVTREYISNHPDYKLHSFENSLSICFNYKDIPAEELCQLLYDNASLMVGHGSFKGQSFVRFITINSTNTKEDIIAFFHQLEQNFELVTP